MRDLNIPDSTMLLTLGEKIPRAEREELHSKRLKYCQGTDEERAAALRGVFSFGGELHCFPEVEADPEMGGAANDAWAVERDRIKQDVVLRQRRSPLAAEVAALINSQWKRTQSGPRIVDLAGVEAGIEEEFRLMPFKFVAKDPELQSRADRMMQSVHDEICKLGEDLVGIPAQYLTQQGELERRDIAPWDFWTKPELGQGKIT